MSDRKRLLRRWKIRGTARKPKPPQNAQSTSGHSPQVDEPCEHHRQGAEGHAFQLNNHSQQDEERSPKRRHGAEGHAFQLNNHSQQDDGQVGEST